MTQYIFGYGVGRCGTTSLAHLLNMQPSSDVTHEGAGLHWFPLFTDYIKWRQLLKKKGKKNRFVGNISYFWIQYLPRLMKDFPNSKLIYIWREREEVIESFWNRNQDRLRELLPKINPYLWCLQYPFLGYPPSRELIARTYDSYIALASAVEIKYPDRVYTLHMRDLNNTEKVKELLDYVGISPDRQVVEVVRENVGGQAPVGFVPI